MPGYGVGLSAELVEQLRRQPLDVRGQFASVCDTLADLAMDATVEQDQLTLPGIHDQPHRTETHSFGFNGAVIYRFVGEGQFEIVDVHWPTEVDDGTPAGRLDRNRF